ncbi:MAG: cupin domain-containing protein [Gammaproteobacteria bacterium]|nr:cupin domain-containing protein [Gammaproteobacteria bacterium]MBU6510232.1 cupin domain-containing protein [Gammaproteobacteria bacterium]MDE1984677.1 cupin domain-containing protein [Gammaproteobacteria bacterium]MDE2109011.1 cupin domain-containing protein [Gammaproteobacteria bacterium]MDE2460247.1 cupin domain-containing protein [Gammaproteobacteria bacterium]
MTRPVINIADLKIQSVESEHAPKGKNASNYDIRWGEIASRIGAKKLGYNLTVVAPGKRNCPFHSHCVEEEMFFILAGEGELRFGEERYPVKPGDIIACPSGGPEVAHQIINTGSIEMRYLAVSTLAEVEICDYPDSGKFGVFEDAPADKSQRFRFLSRSGESLDYWDGE